MSYCYPRQTTCDPVNLQKAVNNGYRLLGALPTQGDVIGFDNGNVVWTNASINPDLQAVLEAGHVATNKFIQLNGPNISDPSTTLEPEKITMVDSIFTNEMSAIEQKLTHLPFTNISKADSQRLESSVGTNELTATEQTLQNTVGTNVIQAESIKLTNGGTNEIKATEQTLESGSNKNKITASEERISSNITTYFSATPTSITLANPTDTIGITSLDITIKTINVPAEYLGVYDTNVTIPSITLKNHKIIMINKSSGSIDITIPSTIWYQGIQYNGITLSVTGSYCVAVYDNTDYWVIGSYTIAGIL
jgi:hypothetical protein